MKLITQNGQLDLPRDFSLTIERNNPILSGDGDSSIPATLPSSSRNLAALGHRERIDRANRYTNKVEAILQVGSVQKRGQLVIDTMHRREGIDASFAIDSSDLYVKSKSKTLKEIFSEWDNGNGYKVTFNDIEEACRTMIDIYQNGNADGDYVVFPVSIAPYEEGEDDNKETKYQYNNEDDGSGSLIYTERIVREGDINMCVPLGYGIAPFLKLYRLLQRLFECLGYTVVYNCFETLYYKQIVIVHNCADCLCNPSAALYYSDLVPSCTLSEFLEWLLAKFHVQPVVDSESMQVSIMKMDAILNHLNDTGGYDLDISRMVVGDWTVQLNPSKRVVLTPTNEIEGTEPAAETFDKLLEKYETWADCNEDQFDSLTGATPAFYDCLVRRKATGMFYLLERDLGTGAMQLHELGSNYFTYDRNNSDETEDFSQEDVMPLMRIDPVFKRGVSPFIGERIHRHTSYNGEADDSEQKIIAVQAYTGQSLFSFPTTGTTQKDIPYASGHLTFPFNFGMDNYSMYPYFWANYNQLLLNNPVHLTGKVKYSIMQFLGMNMSALKLCNGQRLLPVKASAQIGDKMGMTEAEFILAKSYKYGVTDSQPTPMSESKLKWQMTTESDARTVQTIANRYINDYGTPPVNQLVNWSINHDNRPNNIWIGNPKSLGETRTITIPIEITLKVVHNIIVNEQIMSWEIRYYKDDKVYDENWELLEIAGLPSGVLSTTKTYTFVAVEV